MHLHMIIDEPRWAFGQVSRGLGAAVRKLGHKFTAGTEADPAAVNLVAFAELLPRAQDIPDDQLCVGLMSHWELDSLIFRRHLDRLRTVKAVYAGCGSIAARAAIIIGREVLCIPGGIDADLYRPRTPDVYTRELQVGWSGNALMREKNYEMAVEACKWAGVKLRAVGLGPGLELLPLDKMPHWHAQNHVYLCTSSEDTGPSGPLEAAACGVPTISTSCGFMPTFIHHGETGWICNTVDQMAAELERLRDRVAEGRELIPQGWIARKHVENHWSWDHRCKPYLLMADGHPLDSTYFPDSSPERKRSVERAVNLRDWRDMRKDHELAVELRKELYIEVANEEQLEAQMLPGERQLIRKCAGVYAKTPELAQYAADWLNISVGVCPQWWEYEQMVDMGNVKWMRPDPRPTAVICPCHVKDDNWGTITKRLNKRSKKLRWQTMDAPANATLAWTRSKMLTDFLTQTDGEVGIVLDDDMSCSADDMEALALKALELDSVVSTVVSKRAFGHGWIPLIKQVPFKFPEDRVLELGEGEYAGAAMNAYPRTALERMAKNLPLVMPHGCPHTRNGIGAYPFFMDQLVEAEDGIQWMTEDRSFCDLARKMGEKVYIHLLPVVYHHGSHPFRPQDGQPPLPPKEDKTDGRSEEESGTGEA